MEDPVGLVRRAARSVAFGAITATMLAALEAQMAIAPARKDELLGSYRRAYLDRLIELFGVNAIRVPSVMTPARGPRLVVANHRSALDIALLVRFFGGNIVSRADIAQWPLLGRAARVGGTIFVDRGEGMKRASAARTIRRRLAAGATVTVFPEGTTNKGDEVKPFFAGLFAAAKGLDCEVVPVGLAYEAGAEFREPTFLKHLSNTASRATTRVAMVVGQGLVFDRDSREMAERSRAAVQTLVHQARELIDRK